MILSGLRRIGSASLRNSARNCGNGNNVWVQNYEYRYSILPWRKEVLPEIRAVQTGGIQMGYKIRLGSIRAQPAKYYSDSSLIRYKTAGLTEKGRN